MSTVTSEIAMMNSECVVLAADSAATVEGGSTKIYTTDKIFRLSDSQPLGAMVFGDNDIDGVPFGIVIKAYRDSLGDRRFDTVKECAEDFMDFLAGGCPVNGVRMVTEEHVRAETARMTCRVWKDLAESAMSEWDARRSDGAQACVSPDSLMAAGIQRALNDLRDRTGGNLPTADLGDVTDAVSGCRSLLEREEPAISFGMHESGFVRLVAAMMGTPGSTDDYTGLVFAGYGDKEHYPSIREYRVAGLFRSGLNHMYKGEIGIDAEVQSWIGSFAQSDVIRSYLYGINEGLQMRICDTMRRMLDDATLAIVDSTDAEYMRENVERRNQILIDSFVSSLEMYEEERFLDPVRRSIMFLSKDELAVLAESLINFTSLRRRYPTSTRRSEVRWTSPSSRSMRDSSG